MRDVRWLPFCKKKIDKSSYLSNGSTSCNEIWHSDGRHLAIIGTVSNPKPDFHVVNLYAKFDVITFLHGSKVQLFELNFSATSGHGAKYDVFYKGEKV